MVFSKLFALAALPLVVLAAPSRFQIPNLASTAVHPLTNIASCPVNNVTLPLPAGATIAVPSGQTLLAVSMGVGVQNYTCTNGTYVSAGAVASLYDISCLAGTPGFAKVQDDFFALPSFAQQIIRGFADKTQLLYAKHYFVTNPTTGTGISPKFALAANGGSVFTTLAKTGSIKSPTSTANVDWLQLNSIAGTLATTVFRVDTKAGQPPTTCTGTQATSIPYAAKYYFYH